MHINKFSIFRRYINKKASFTLNFSNGAITLLYYLAIIIYDAIL